MQLSTLLSEDAICTRLETSERDDALRELLSLLIAAGRLSQKQLQPVLDALIDRERLGSTAIGKGMAVPHARVAGVDEIVMALGVSEEGVQFRALDSEPVRAVFLIVGPAGPCDDYIEVLRRISVLIQNGDFRSFLLRSASGAETLALIEEMDV